MEAHYEVLQKVWGSNGVTRFSHKFFLILVISRLFVKPTDRHKEWPVLLIYEKKDKIRRYKVGPTATNYACHIVPVRLTLTAGPLESTTSGTVTFSLTQELKLELDSFSLETGKVLQMFLWLKRANSVLIWTGISKNVIIAVSYCINCNFLINWN